MRGLFVCECSAPFDSSLTHTIALGSKRGRPSLAAAQGGGQPVSVWVAVRKEGCPTIQSGDVKPVRPVLREAGVHRSQLVAGTGARRPAFERGPIGGEIKDDPARLTADCALESCRFVAVRATLSRRCVLLEAGV